MKQSPSTKLFCVLKLPPERDSVQYSSVKCKWCKSMRRMENSVVKVSLRETLDTLGLSRNFFSTQSFHIISFQSENRKLEGRNPYKD